MKSPMLSREGFPINSFVNAQLVSCQGVIVHRILLRNIGQDAGASMNASLNPIAACVEDATTAVIFLIGSKFSKKWQFLKVRRYTLSYSQRPI